MKIFIFTGGNAPLPNDYFTWLKNNGKIKNPRIIAADSGIDILTEYNDFSRLSGDSLFYFVPNYLLGDMDSFKLKSVVEKLKENNFTAFTQYPKDKDFSDTELALRTAFEIKEYDQDSQVILVGGTGGRTDHLISIFDSFSTKYHADVWLGEKEAVYYLKKNTEYTISGLNKDSCVSVARLSSSRRRGQIVSDGLFWEGKCYQKKGMISLSNRISDENLRLQKPVKIKSKCSAVLLFLPFYAIVSPVKN